MAVVFLKGQFQNNPFSFSRLQSAYTTIKDSLLHPPVSTAVSKRRLNRRGVAWFVQGVQEAQSRRFLCTVMFGKQEPLRE
jgi:hypothetical protein